jgi:carboxymethylenebutenolidase
MAHNYHMLRRTEAPMAIIEYAANGGTAHGYLATPARPNGKGVIVIQEWWGLVPHIQDIADRFAAEGYLALAPDLWDGKKTTNPDEAGRMLMALDIDDTARKLAGAAAALHAHGAAGKLAVVGFCMGGQLALYAAAAMPEDIGACVNFYGIHPKVQPDYARLAAPVLAFFAEQDTFVPPAAGREIARAIEAAGGRCEVHVFDAGHAFFNDARPEAYHAESAQKAWALTREFLGSRL